MYVLTLNGVVEKYPYSFGDLRRDNKEVSFPEPISESLLSEWGVFVANEVSFPPYNSLTENIKEGIPTFGNNGWERTWIVEPLSEEEAANRLRRKQEEVTMNRKEAYRNESDPLFFKAQRGESTMQEWESKVFEIKARYPKDLI